VPKRDDLVLKAADLGRERPHRAEQLHRLGLDRLA
jgi:hypothetical protein